MSDAALYRLGGEGPDVLLIDGFGADRLPWLALAPNSSPSRRYGRPNLPVMVRPPMMSAKERSPILPRRLRLRSPAGWQSRLSSVIRSAVRLALFRGRAAR